MRKAMLLGFTLMALSGSLPALAADEEGTSPAAPYVSLRAVPRQARVVPGETFPVALEIRLSDGWVYYSPAPGEEARKIGVPPARIRTVAEGMTAGETLWPADFLHPAESGFPAVWSYRGRLTVYVPLSVSADAAPGERTIVLQPTGQICGPAGCLELQGFAGRANFAARTRVVVAAESQVDPAWEEDVSLAEGLAKARTAAALEAAHRRRQADAAEDALSGGTEAPAGFGAALGVALLAGLTLNVMPCVLPVLPIRILSLVETAGRSRRRFVTMGLAYAGGMMAFFAGIAAINTVLKIALGTGFDLNQGFQHPAVIVGLAMVLVATAANLLGVFEVVVPGKIAALELNVQNLAAGHVRAALMGLLTAVLATPCSFAFLAAATAYAQAAPLPEGTAVLLGIGAGMTFPHAVLAAFPSLVDRLPRPGAWMERFRRTAGFLLLLVAVWLFSTLRDGSAQPFRQIAWAVVLVFCLWVWSSWVPCDASLSRKIFLRSLAVVLAFGSGLWLLRPPAKTGLEPVSFDAVKMERARSEGKTVLVRFTASWCLKCLQQEYQVYRDPRLADAIRTWGVVYLEGDVSRADSPAAEWMHRHGYGAGIPLTIVFPPRGKPLPPMRSDLTAERLIEALRRAATEGKNPVEEERKVDEPAGKLVN